MWKKMRIRFTATACCAVLLILVIVLGSLNVFSYLQIQNQSHSIVTMIKETEGDLLQSQEYMIGGQAVKDIRYFIGTCDENGYLEDVSISHIGSVSLKQATMYIDQILASSKSKGILTVKHYAYYYEVVKTADNIYVVVLNITHQLNTARNLLLASLIIGGGSLAVFAIFMYLLSYKVIAPYQKTYEKQKTFITHASHELRTPLAIISANNDIMMMLHEDDEWCQSTKQQIDRLNRLISELINQARFEENAIQLTRVDASAIVCETADEWKTVMRDYQYEVEVTPHLYVLAEPAYLKELINILLDNASKYTTPQGYIGVSLTSKGHQVSLRVENDYPEQPDLDPERFFTRFYRENQIHHAGVEGSGIGLSMAESIVQSFHGEIHNRYQNGRIVMQVLLAGK